MLEAFIIETRSKVSSYEICVWLAIYPPPRARLSPSPSPRPRPHPRPHPNPNPKQLGAADDDDDAAGDDFAPGAESEVEEEFDEGDAERDDERPVPSPFGVVPPFADE